MHSFALAGMALFTACQQSNANTALKKPISRNYVALLDFEWPSIISRTVFKRHTGVGAVVWPLWKDVRRNLVIKSRDKFRVRIIPQGSKLPAEQWENTLCLDMSVLDAGAKARALNTFKGQLHEHLQQLYAAANQGGRSADYFGVDIWKYFNDQVTTDILPGYDNTMLVLTDGYFDFENEAHTMRKKNRFTSTRFYLPWAVLIGSKGQKWRPGFIACWGSFQCKLAGLRTKTKNDDLLQNKKLPLFGINGYGKRCTIDRYSIGCLCRENKGATGTGHPYRSIQLELVLVL